MEIKAAMNTPENCFSDQFGTAYVRKQALLQVIEKFERE